MSPSRFRIWHLSIIITLTMAAAPTIRGAEDHDLDVPNAADLADGKADDRDDSGDSAKARETLRLPGRRPSLPAMSREERRAALNQELKAYSDSASKATGVAGKLLDLEVKIPAEAESDPLSRNLEKADHTSIFLAELNEATRKWINEEDKGKRADLRKRIIEEGKARLKSPEKLEAILDEVLPEGGDEEVGARKLHELGVEAHQLIQPHVRNLHDIVNADQSAPDERRDFDRAASEGPGLQGRDNATRDETGQPGASEKPGQQGQQQGQPGQGQDPAISDPNRTYGPPSNSQPDPSPRPSRDEIAQHNPMIAPEDAMRQMMWQNMMQQLGQMQKGNDKKGGHGQGGKGKAGTSVPFGDSSAGLSMLGAAAGLAQSLMNKFGDAVSNAINSFIEPQQAKPLSLTDSHPTSFKAIEAQEVDGPMQKRLERAPAAQPQAQGPVQPLQAIAGGGAVGAALAAAGAGGAPKGPPPNVGGKGGGGSQPPGGGKAEGGEDGVFNLPPAPGDAKNGAAKALTVAYGEASGDEGGAVGAPPQPTEAEIESRGDAFPSLRRAKNGGLVQNWVGTGTLGEMAAPRLGRPAPRKTVAPSAPVEKIDTARPELPLING